MPTAPPVPDEQRRALLGVVAVLRAALVVWSAAVVAVDVGSGTELRLAPAVVLLVVTATWTASFAALVRHSPRRLRSRWFQFVDVALAVVLVAADPLLYDGPHPQSYASAWPMTAAVVVGILHGARPGALTGVAIGVASAGARVAWEDGGLDGRVLGAAGTVVLLAVAGGLAGVVTGRLREAEVVGARARAREEVARTLHDGVLQTLAVVQRRSDDDELVRLAREQEQELRRFLVDRTAPAHHGGGRVDVVEVLHRTLASSQRRTGMDCRLTIVDPPPPVGADVADAVAGAVGEAVVNAHKHGGAATVTVCVDHERGRLSCSVVDDGNGFDPAHTPEGLGLTTSVRSRLAPFAGAVEVRSAPGRGCELLLTCTTDADDGR